MQGSHGKIGPESAFEPSDEASLLEQHLQRQLEEDIARIFDESIYSDIEVVCGKFKILTHSCILKARTSHFYRKLETIRHVNVGRSAYDEIYSFISDIYTECEIHLQEDEIIKYLHKNLSIVATTKQNNWLKKEETEEPEVFLTPKCSSPYLDNTFHKGISCSPSTELTREYYALVPIESNLLLDKELVEQDVLSNAFQAIIKKQPEDLNKLFITVKPTSLSLRSSHSSQTIKHSNSCDILTKHGYNRISTDTLKDDKKEINQNTSQTITKTSNTHPCNINSDSEQVIKEFVLEKVVDNICSPDSLIIDDLSSSSNYLSAAYNLSTGLNLSSCITQLNVGDNVSKMENICPSSDSGLENTLLESVGSHRDVTITDISLTESTLHELMDEANNSQDSSASQKINPTTKLKDSVKTSKEEKQRQNEEIVILESSSLSSETGSWESVFPSKLNKDKEMCVQFINIERQISKNDEQSKQIVKYDNTDLCSSLVQKSPFKSTPCFIDAASLVDEEEDTIKLQCEVNGSTEILTRNIIPTSSQPVPCSSIKVDISPNEWSESNEDSLEQGDGNKDSDSMQKDLSPTIFDMTPITEDSLCTNVFENALLAEQEKKNKVFSNDQCCCSPVKEVSLSSSSVFVSATPHNSIMSLQSSSLKQFEPEERESDTTVVGRHVYTNFKSQTKYYESPPIISGGASIEDHLPEIRSASNSLLLRNFSSTKNLPIIDNMPIVSGAYIPKVERKNHQKLLKPSCAPAWVVDMSSSLEPNIERKNSSNSKKAENEVCKNHKNELKSGNIIENSNKSRSSVDSETGSEKSSHQFYIDLSSLPDPLPPKKDCKSESINEKKNCFSMYIDLGKQVTLKEMPSRLSSSLTVRKKCSDNKNLPKITKPAKINVPCPTTIAPNNINVTDDFETIESLCSDPKISISEIIATSEAEKCNSDLNATFLITSEIEKTDSGSNETVSKQLEIGKHHSDNFIFPKISDTDIDDSGKNTSFPKISETEKQVFDTILTPKTTVKHNSGICYNKNDPLDGSERNTSIQYNPEMIIHEELVDQSGDLFVKLSDLDKPSGNKIETRLSFSEKRDVLDVRMTRSIPDNNWGEKQSGSSSMSKVISSFHSENALSLNRLFPHLKNEFTRSMPGSLSSRTRSPLRLGMSSSQGEIEEQTSDVSEISSIQSSMCRSVVENSTTEEISRSSSLIGNCQSRLGQDLLRMFLEEIAPDVIVEVSGRRIKAHKCILSSRCQYFAGILGGGWVESAGNVIVLPPFSYNVVHFALCHIYSGVSTIPDSISIVELATIADMLGLEGLKEAIMFTLKAKYCHHFHKPCAVCTAGVLECFPLSSVYGLDDLYRKCLRWITKHFAKVWPTKAFATLPKELLDKCYQQHVVNFTPENIVDTIFGCGLTVCSLQNSRWAESVARICRRLVNAAAHFAAPRLLVVLRALSSVPSDAPSPAVQALDDCMATAFEWAPPDETCRVYAFLSSLVKEMRSNNYIKPDLITNGNQNKEEQNLLYTHANKWRLLCESSLVRAAPRAVSTQAFKDLAPELRKRLRELGCIMYGATALPTSSSAPVHDKRSRNNYNGITSKSLNASSNRNLDIDQVRSSFVPYASKPQALGSKEVLLNISDLPAKKPLRNTPLRVRTTKAQEERAKFNLSKTHQSQECLNKPQNKRGVTYENTKSRYMEPKTNKDSAENKLLITKKLVPKIVSSSESSRNTSPNQIRMMRASRVKSCQVRDVNVQSASQDSLATCSRPRTAEPSTDSLSESQKSNRYATYTKTKHTTKGSVESIKSSKPLSVTRTTPTSKIPVYNNHNKTSNGDPKVGCKKTSNSTKQANPSPLARHRTSTERKNLGSLMNATKSSSAKIVPKIAKEASSNKISRQKGPVKQTSSQNPTLPAEVPVMERSGTFLKDEPTFFGDQATIIEID